MRCFSVATGIDDNTYFLNSSIATAIYIYKYLLKWLTHCHVFLLTKWLLCEIQILKWKKCGNLQHLFLIKKIRKVLDFKKNQAICEIDD
jgi:hypothetical protein